MSLGLFWIIGVIGGMFSGSLAETPGTPAFRCVIRSTEDAREQVRGVKELFIKLIETTGFGDYLSSLQGCPWEIKRTLSENLAAYSGRIPQLKFPLDQKPVWRCLSPQLSTKIEQSP